MEAVDDSKSACASCAEIRADVAEIRADFAELKKTLVHSMDTLSEQLHNLTCSFVTFKQETESALSELKQITSRGIRSSLERHRQFGINVFPKLHGGQPTSGFLCAYKGTVFAVTVAHDTNETVEQKIVKNILIQLQDEGQTLLVCKPLIIDKESDIMVLQLPDSSRALQGAGLSDKSPIGLSVSGSAVREWEPELINVRGHIQCYKMKGDLKLGHVLMHGNYSLHGCSGTALYDADGLVAAMVIGVDTLYSGFAVRNLKGGAYTAPELMHFATSATLELQQTNSGNLLAPAALLRQALEEANAKMSQL